MQSVECGMNDINPEEIQKQIKNNKILNKFVYFDTVDSTNKRLAENDYASGTIILAGEQASGRGKRGAAWVSPRGGLWFSFVINKKIRRPYDYVVLSSVAVAEALKKFGVKPEIKWPNDVLVNNRKIAGILIENDYYEGRLITGMGVNVNNAPPKGINATSLKKELKQNIDILNLFISITGKIDSYLYGLKAGRKRLISKWAGLQKDMIGKQIRYYKSGRIVKAQMLKVQGGKVIIKDSKGRIKALSGEVFFK